MRKSTSLFITTMVLVLLTVISANAQVPKALVYGNFTIAAPQGDEFTKAYNQGAGGEIGGGIGIGKTMLIGSLGYINYAAINSNVSILGDLKVIPIKVGIRRYLVGKLFVNGQIGAVVESYTKSSATGTKFLYEVGAGVKIIHLIEVGVAYTGYPAAAAAPYNINYNSLLFKVGFSVKL